MRRRRRDDGRPAIHLASYKSQQAADRGWAQIRRAHAALLGELKHEVSRINLGAGKGVFFRLRAGPLATQEAASELCQKLKSRRQFCETSPAGSRRLTVETFVWNLKSA
ncbi:MAG: SPOR domain-containing protein [Rhodospirillales bacterium]|nr:SPOR domain-containing protein [Rhodospirillales bacterium]